MKAFTLLTTSLLLALAPIQAQQAEPTSTPLTPELEKALQRREAAKQELSNLQAEINGIRVELQTELQPLEEKSEELRRKLGQLQRDAENFDDVQRAIARRLEALRAEFDYAAGQSRTYLDGVTTRLNAAESNTYGKRFAEAASKVNSAGQDRDARMLASLDAIMLGLERLEQLPGGHIFPGNIEIDGKVVKGNYALVGPAPYFATEDGSQAGLAQLAPGDPLPKLVPFEKDAAAAVLQLAKAEEASILLDPTQGFGLKAETQKETLGQFLEKGGVVGYAIVGLGIIAVLIAIFKFIEISALKAPRLKHINQLLDFIEHGNQQGALNFGREVGGAAGKMIRIAAERYQSKRRILEEQLFEQIIRLKPKAERFLPFVAVTAAAAPLMGLLGTVMGMIKTFKVITEQGTGDPKNLAGGISEALITTQLGLVVAIPCLILHGVLKRQSKEKIGLFESAGLSLLNGLNDMDDRAGRSEEEEDDQDDDNKDDKKPKSPEPAPPKA